MLVAVWYYRAVEPFARGIICSTSIMVYPSRLLLLKSASNLKWTHFSRNFSPGLFSLLGKWNFQYWTCQSETFKSWNFSVQDLSVLNFSVPDITVQYTEVHFDSFLSGEFTTKAVINPPERKLAKHTSVQCTAVIYSFLVKKDPIILALWIPWKQYFHLIGKLSQWCISWTQTNMMYIGVCCVLVAYLVNLKFLNQG